MLCVSVRPPYVWTWTDKWASIPSYTLSRGRLLLFVQSLPSNICTKDDIHLVSSLHGNKTTKWPPYRWTNISSWIPGQWVGWSAVLLSCPPYALIIAEDEAFRQTQARHVSLKRSLYVANVKLLFVYLKLRFVYRGWRGRYQDIKMNGSDDA